MLPQPVLRNIDRVRTRRFLAKVGPPTAEYVRRNGLEVSRGPFAGLRYLDGLERSSGDLVAKLAGTYERELHGVVSQWVAAAYPHVIDVGCAEGYYAVGFAHAMPGTTVHAFDIDASARAQCASLAELNGVATRVDVRGACAPASLDAFPAEGVALLADCEGYERVLLDPAIAPRLIGWPVLVELHEFIDGSITSEIRGRFEATHEVEIIEGEDREQDAALAELAFMSASERAAVLGEHRPGPMRWAHMRPR